MFGWKTTRPSGKTKTFMSYRISDSKFKNLNLFSPPMNSSFQDWIRMRHFQKMIQNNPKTVIYFDGVCNLCNFFVDFVIRRDQKKIFFFTSLQGRTAQDNLGDLAKNLSSVIVRDPTGAVLSESKAVLFVLSRMSFPWPFLSMLGRIFPPLFRDWIYRKVAIHRYFLFGQRQTCRIPNPEEQARFLD